MDIPSPASVPANPSKLLGRLRAAIRLRHCSQHTEESYVAWVCRFILFHGKRNPMEMGAAEINRFLTHLVVAGHVIASRQN
jgi:hypothetical protein